MLNARSGPYHFEEKFILAILAMLGILLLHFLGGPIYSFFNKPDVTIELSTADILSWTSKGKQVFIDLSDEATDRIYHETMHNIGDIVGYDFKDELIHRATITENYQMDVLILNATDVDDRRLYYSVLPQELKIGSKEFLLYRNRLR